MRKSVRITALILASVMLCTAAASAAVVDTRVFGSVLAANKYMRLAAPLIYASGDAVQLCADIGANAETEKPETVERGTFAYVVSANQRMNMESGLYFAELTLINETGIFTVQTIDDVEDYDFNSILTTDKVGRLRDWEGKFVYFNMKGTDKIQKLGMHPTGVKTSFDTADGLYLVNVVDERNGIVTFFDTSSDIDNVQNAQAEGCRFRDDGYAVIAVDDADYVGSILTKIGRGVTSLHKGIGNAIIQISEGEIIRVFSFESGYEI